MNNTSIKNLLAGILLVFLSSGFSYLKAQDPITTAKAAKDLFPDEKIVLTESNVTVEFEENRRGEMQVIERKEDEFICLDKNQKLVYPVFYDEFSRIIEFKGDIVGRPQDTYYQDNNIFHSDVRVKYGGLVLPQFGSQVSMETAKVYTDVKYMTRVYLTQSYSSLNRSVKFIIPASVDVELIPMNFDGYHIDVQKTTKKSKRIVTYSINDLPKYSDESGLPGNSYIYPHILIVTKSYQINGVTKQQFNSTADLYKWYSTLTKRVDNQRASLKPLVDELTEGKETDRQKIESIFYWVQDNIRYIAFEDGIAGFQPEDCQTVYGNKYGDCKGMANLTKELLQLAGFDSRLAWLGTRQISYDYSVPSLSVDNHMICALKLEDEYIFLDATEKYMSLGEYAERIQGKQTLIEDGDSYVLEHIPKRDFEQNFRKIDLDITMNGEQELTGTVKYALQGEAKADMMHYISRTATDKQETLLKQYMGYFENSLRVSDVEVPELDRDAGQLVIDGEITISNKVSAFGEEAYLYLNPYTFLANFDLEDDRKYDYWFSYKKNDHVQIRFEVPEGWEISTVPAPVSLSDEEFEIDIKYQQSERDITYDMFLKIPEAKISASNIKGWNDAIKTLENAYDQPVILKKQ